MNPTLWSDSSSVLLQKQKLKKKSAKKRKEADQDFDNKYLHHKK